MHAAEREKVILEVMKPQGFVTYRELESRLGASPATIRRDLSRLERENKIARVHGGAKLAGEDRNHGIVSLAGTPFTQSITQNLDAKRAIGRIAAGLCEVGEAVMIDGGTTTLQMCPHLAGLGLQVLTNSLHIVTALLPYPDIRIHVPSGAVFREQNIILAPSGEPSMPRFHAPKLFLGAAAIGLQGVMQADVVLVAAERRFIERAEKVIVVVDSTKFHASSGAIVCGLDEIDILVTDAGLPKDLKKAIEAAGVEILIAS